METKFNSKPSICKYKVIVYSPPPHPVPSHVSFVRAYYCSLPLIARCSLYGIRYATQDGVSQKIHCSYFSNCYIFHLITRPFVPNNVIINFGGSVERQAAGCFNLTAGNIKQDCTNFKSWVSAAPLIASAV